MPKLENFIYLAQYNFWNLFRFLNRQLIFSKGFRRIFSEKLQKIQTAGYKLVPAAGCVDNGIIRVNISYKRSTSPAYAYKSRWNNLRRPKNYLYFQMYALYENVRQSKKGTN